MLAPKLLVSSAICLFFVLPIAAQQGATCDANNQCASGCCSQQGRCGFGDAFCGDGCQSGCDAQPECGRGAGEGFEECLAGACCSPQGFCGIGPEFCTDCQNEGGCSVDPRQCSPKDSGAMGLDVRIGYYDLYSSTRQCHPVQPENLPAGVFTHITVSYAVIEDGQIATPAPDILARTSRLKRRYHGLKVHALVGGWMFNDPVMYGDAPEILQRWSEMVSTVPNMDRFIDSVIMFLREHALDGIDIDWRYPGDVSRGGSIASQGESSDYTNLVIFMSRLRDAMDADDGSYELTMSVPYDYAKLRGFSLESLSESVDWFNVHAYDMHDLWEEDGQARGRIRAHANTTLIAHTLDLFERNGIPPEKIVLGIGFHGTSYTLQDTACNKPGCEFSGPGFPGDCSEEQGVLSYQETLDLVTNFGTETFHDEATASTWMVSSLSQWISYEDSASLAAKTEFLQSRCLRGFAAWSADLDTHDHQALTALVGEEAISRALVDNTLDPGDRRRLVDDLAAYTGQNCYVTYACTDGTNNDANAKCKPGFLSVDTAHAPSQINRGEYVTPCEEGSWHHVCCPGGAMPQNCEWRGEPERNVFGCSEGCGEGQFQLTKEPFRDEKGEGECYTGYRSLCCDRTEILTKCTWSDDCGAKCGDDHVEVAKRYDDEHGDRCPDDGYRTYCCPKDETDAAKNCKWANDMSRFPDESDPSTISFGLSACFETACPKDELAVTGAKHPESLYELQNTPAYPRYYCRPFDNSPSDTIHEYKLCCEPPSIYNSEWPVKPSYLWSDTDDSEDDDTTWQWANNFGNNNADVFPSDLDEDHGGDAYGFVVLNGPPGSIHNAFAETFTVVQRDEPPERVRPRSLMTTNATVMRQVWDHAEDTVRVYCNYPAGSTKCRQIFYKGAKDTIIRLPEHVGEGPWARVVSMEQEPEHEELPPWVQKKRDLTNTHQNGIYVLKFDYNFHLVKRQEDEEPIKMRIDFTNMEGYWDDITSAAPSRKRALHERVSFDEWRSHVDHVKANLTRRSSPRPPINTALTVHTIHRRWWGSFTDWIRRLTTVTTEETGELPMTFSKYFTLFSGRLFCRNDAGVTFSAGLDVTADISLNMDTRYSYYFSGNLLPTPDYDMYAYVRTQPSVTAGIGLAGDASLAYATRPKKLISTLTYPGLAIKGIAAVGPMLDIWGQLDGTVTVAGSMRAGVTYTLKPIEMYLPNDDETRNRAEKNLDSNDIDQEGFEPTFEANVKAEVDFNVRVSPEVSMGIQVGGRIGGIDGLLVDAHVSAFANTTLNFNAKASAQTQNLDYGWSYDYSLNFLYRIGLAAVAQIKFYGEWRTRTYYPVDWQTIRLWGPDEPIKSGDVPRASKRGIASRRWQWSDTALPGAIFDAPLITGWEPEEFDLPFAQYDNATLTATKHRRQAESQPQDDSKSDMEFTLGGSRFTCNSEPSSCIGSSVDHNEDLESRSLGPWLGSLVTSSSSSSLAKRVPTTTDKCSVLPRLYYNCETAFPDFAFNVPTSQTGGRGATHNMPGICQTLRDLMADYSAITMRGDRRAVCRGNVCTLTYDNTDGNVNARRNAVCKDSSGRSTCAPENVDIAAKLWTAGNERTPSGGYVSCDEFPFASTEEGGSEYGADTAVADLFATKTRCVPTWQQNLQGNCNRLPRSLETNVRYYNKNNGKQPIADTSTTPLWKQWTDGGWAREGAPGWVDKDSNGNDVNIQRKTKGRYYVPRPVSFSETEWYNGERKTTWYHRRNYTVALAEATDSGMDFPESKDVSGNMAAGGAQVQAADVLCAISTMGQSRYRIGSGRYNGWCKSGQRRAWAGFEWNGVAQRPEYKSCTVHFTPDFATLKRDGTPPSPIGKLGEHDIYGIEYVEPSEGGQVFYI